MTEEKRKELAEELEEFKLRAADLHREKVDLTRQINKVVSDIKINDWNISQHRYLLNPRGDEK